MMKTGKTDWISRALIVTMGSQHLPPDKENPMTAQPETQPTVKTFPPTRPGKVTYLIATGLLISLAVVIFTS